MDVKLSIKLNKKLMLRKNIVNPKFRKLIWSIVIIATAASWAPTLTRLYANMNKISFSHFDQELAISCTLDYSSTGTEWVCNKNQPLELYNYNPENKSWVYESDDGPITVTRSINDDVVKLIVDHPKLGGKQTTYVE